MSAHTHLAGVIPVSNLDTDFELDTPPFLLPVEPGFTAIQKAVFECAMAGCQTIWIAANDDLAPIVRKRIGEWVYDPVHYKRDLTKFYSEVRKEIPIYYVPIHPKDRDKRDSYGWSVLYGMYTAWLVSYKISKWAVPDKYFISFPMGIYDIYNLRQQRPHILTGKSNFFVSHDGKTVKDNEHLAFTMFGEDFKQCRRSVNKKTTREYLPPGPGETIPHRKLPVEERWSARSFAFEDIFEKVDETNATTFEVEWYHNISTWDGYRAYLGSENVAVKPYKGLTGPYGHAKMCMEVEEE